MYFHGFGNGLCMGDGGRRKGRGAFPFFLVELKAKI